MDVYNPSGKPPRFQHLQTPRLVLRRLQTEDLRQLVAYRNDPEVMRYQGWHEFSTERARDLISASRMGNLGIPNSGFQLAIADRRTNQLIGDCYFALLYDDQQQAEIGYTLARAFWGQGLAREALEALIDYAFRVLNLQRVIARTALANRRSRAVLERLGFRHEGTLRQSFLCQGQWLDEMLYAMLQSDWHRRTVLPRLSADYARQVALQTLAAELACSPGDFARNETQVFVAEERPGRRGFPFRSPSLDVATFGRGVVISCNPERMAAVQAIVANATREQIFSPQILSRLHQLVAVDQQTLVGPNYAQICWPSAFRPVATPDGVTVRVLQDDELEWLYQFAGFEHALEYWRSGPRPDVLAAIAEVDQTVVAVAGVSADNQQFWQIGVDVRPIWRGHGLGRVVVAHATEAVFAAGRIPHYVTSASHLVSARIAASLGYQLAWVSAWAANVEA